MALYHLAAFIVLKNISMNVHYLFRSRDGNPHVTYNRLEYDIYIHMPFSLFSIFFLSGLVSLLVSFFPPPPSCRYSPPLLRVASSVRQLSVVFSS